MRSLVLATSLLALTGVPALAADGAVLKGTVHYDGPAIRPRPLRMSADPKCEKAHEGERTFTEDRLVSKDGGVENVFVYLEEAPPGTGPFEAPSKPKELRQKGCQYEPRVQGILVLQDLDVVNDDPTLHNVRCEAKDNRPFNIGQPAGGKHTKFFTTPEEAVHFKCDVHPWMAAFIFVMSHPYFAISDADGSFALPALPPGKYTLHAWHEIFGRLEQTVTVKAGAGATVDFVYHGEPK